MQLILSGVTAVSLLFTWGCVNDLFSRPANFDGRPLTVLNSSLFNQRTSSRLVKRPWKGDWVLRRDRLEMVDRDLRNAQPDIILFQESMERIGSVAESDSRILGAGSLSEYEWRQQNISEYGDTQEAESMVIAARPPLKFTLKTDGRGETWTMGGGGFLMTATLDFESQPVVVFNVQMPPANAGGYVWYTFVQERILAKMRKEQICPKRLVVGGYLPGDETNKRFAEFVKTLQLRDSSAGFCQVAARCFTATPINDIFMATIGEEAPARVDKIFVHSSANIFSSGRFFEDSDATDHYIREFGISKLWPTQRFGWKTQLRMARCTSSEIEQYQQIL